MSDWPDRMLWLDLETSGLDVDTDVVVEIGAMVTDLDGQALDEGWWVIDRPELTVADIRAWPERVREMHNASGLLAELHSGRTHTVTAAVNVINRMKHECGTAAQTFVLAGNGVDHMERLWIRHPRHGLGRLGRGLSYWSIDPSVIRRSLKLWGAAGKHRDVAHRALPDCRQARDEWLEQRDLLRPAWGAP
jgi:oligoribonuclease